MAIKSKVASTTRKKTTPKAKVLKLDQSRIQESDERKWTNELCEFIESLSEPERTAVLTSLDLIVRRPRGITHPAEVIPFNKEVQ